jgi:glycosyltransferase involved in cell wall biosynthesis
MARVEDSTFVISTNGFGDGPAQALRDYLVRSGAATLTFVAHPLDRDSDNRHLVSTYQGGRLTEERAIAIPSRPPFTYPLDFVVPARLPRCDAWLGFNNLACLRGLARRRVGLAGRVFYWAVDFVPNRFGPGLVTRAYDGVDRFACRSADARIELSRAALEGRAAHLGLSEAAPTLLAPTGAWLDRVPHVAADAWQRRRVVYLGHLVERQGVSTLLEALVRLPGVAADIVGSGPLAQSLRAQAESLGLADRVTFLGYVGQHSDVEAILAGGSVAVAPYVDSPDNFTRYADPGKLKSYLAAGLPIVLTRVPPNAAEIERAGAGRIVLDSAEALAAGIEALLTDSTAWRTASEAASAYALQFDWGRILGGTLRELGFT